MEHEHRAALHLVLTVTLFQPLNLHVSFFVLFVAARRVTITRILCFLLGLFLLLLLRLLYLQAEVQCDGLTEVMLSTVECLSGFSALLLRECEPRFPNLLVHSACLGTFEQKIRLEEAANCYAVRDTQHTEGALGLLDQHPNLVMSVAGK